MDEGWYRLLSVLVAVPGLWEGPLSVAYRLAGDGGGTWLRAPNYLAAPWCYLAAVGATVVALALLAVLDEGRRRALARDSAGVPGRP
ncbi:hypothetical protein RKE29_27175 [Streptomyces sp. B1866]|uniref:hypothetical protein n=1 Tax=Streptomyces sp. B1866 TaxID=3075431 RepID=UPI00289081FE|nr:hypothetical protein [Streptomyces sp. B1866]MDT3400254.1 hypothetical protein [Streptomyces sp. B1866]